jgi:cytoskeletal protein RodZ
VEKESVNEANPNQEKNLAGRVLKETRLAKGLTLDMVHEATKVPMDALKAIEEGYTIRNLSAFYLRGFLKIYANYLGVDKTKIIPDYPQQNLSRPMQTVSDSQEGFDFQGLFSKFWTPKRRQRFLIGLGVIVALFLVIKTFAFIGSHWSSWRDSRAKVASEKRVKAQEKKIAKEKAKTIAVKESVLETAKIKAVEKTKETSRSEVKALLPKEVKANTSSQELPVSQEAVESSSQEKSVVLTVRAKKSGWLRVKVDGDIIFQSTLKSGDVETWRATETIEISGKNIAQLEFELNGKLIGPLSRQERGAQKVVVTKDGLSVAK